MEMHISHCLWLANEIASVDQEPNGSDEGILVEIAKKLLQFPGGPCLPHFIKYQNTSRKTSVEQETNRANNIHHFKILKRKIAMMLMLESFCILKGIRQRRMKPTALKIGA
uniref:Uncharacterized protein n=1 Tax=Romanomermis culicivorax TaxID=13658 RepID=A0A915JEH3_ROMCU